MSCNCTQRPPIIPIRTADPPAKWQSTLQRKPWDHCITAVIPVLDHVDETIACVELLRLQTLKPYIILIDTGSLPLAFSRIEQMRAEDLEVHAIRCHASAHPCGIIASALDLGFSLAWSRFVFTTHQDCFLRNRQFLDFLLSYMPRYSVVGYQISPRKFVGWERWFGHTATLFDTTDWDMIGATWSLRRAARELRIGPCQDTPDLQGNVDTETTMNLCYLRSGLHTRQIGQEQNFIRTRDEWIDHPRSLTCTSLYSPDIYEQQKKTTALALAEANERIAHWRHTGPAETAYDL